LNKDKNNEVKLGLTIITTPPNDMLIIYYLFSRTTVKCSQLKKHGDMSYECELDYS